MARQIKELMLKELRRKFHDIRQTGCVLVHYEGISAGEANRLREEIRRQGGEIHVVKNSLFARALREQGLSELTEMLAGPTAVLRSTDPVAAARAAKEMARTFQGVQLRGAFVEGQTIGPDQVQKLAEIPGREALLSMLAGALLAPLRRLAFGLLAKPRAVLSALEQLSHRTEDPENTEKA